MKRTRPQTNHANQVLLLASYNIALGCFEQFFNLAFLFPAHTAMGMISGYFVSRAEYALTRMDGWTCGVQLPEVMLTRLFYKFMQWLVIPAVASLEPFLHTYIASVPYK